MRKTVLALVLGVMLLPVWAQAQSLPKCRNIAGYEPKPTCEARNQRAQWQAAETARLTGDLVARALAEQAAENRANQKGFMDTVKGLLDSARKTIRGLF